MSGNCAGNLQKIRHRFILLGNRQSSLVRNRRTLKTKTKTKTCIAPVALILLQSHLRNIFCTNTTWRDSQTTFLHLDVYTVIIIRGIISLGRTALEVVIE